MKMNTKLKWSYIDRCKNVFKIVDGMPIGKAHQKRAIDLREQFNTIMAVK